MVYETWREWKVLALASFDMKGSYGAVNRDVLLRRLRQHQLLEVSVR
jgi:hypothetical protein